MSKKFTLLCIFLSLSLLSQAQSTFKTHYKIFGTGYPIVIINGGPGMNSNGFNGMAKSIAALGYQTIIYDQRGTGLSLLDRTDSNTITMDLMVKDLENLRQELKIDQWIVLGHSFGGLLACHYYAQHSGKVSKLIFSSSGGVNLNFLRTVQDRLQHNLTKEQNDSLIYYQQMITQGDTSYSTRYKRAEFLAKAYVYHKSSSPLIAARLMEVKSQVNALVYRDLNRIKFDHTDKFKQHTIPVLVIQGLNDIISAETAKEIQNSFGSATLVLLDECGHYGWLDAPQDYFGAIEKFLKG